MKKFTSIIQIETPRLTIRQWQASDFEAFAELNADPEVMRYRESKSLSCNLPTLKNKLHFQR